MAEFHLQVPLRGDDITKVRVGDLVYFSGPGWTCRSRLLKYAFDEGHRLPFSTADKNLLIHVGPIIIQEGGAWKLISFTPTSSIRFEKWGPRSIEEWGLKAIVGKTTMGKASIQAMQEKKCIHATPIGIIPNFYQDQIEIKDVYWFKELGSIEAAWILDLKDLGPFLVDIDTEGRSYFDELDLVIEKNRRKAFQRLGIPEDFEFTKLY